MKYLILLLLVSCTTTKKRREVLQCPTPDFYDFIPDEPINKQDLAAFERMKVACPEKNIHMPCLIRYVRYNHGEYAALCGRKRKVTLYEY